MLERVGVGPALAYLPSRYASTIATSRLRHGAVGQVGGPAQVRSQHDVVQAPQRRVGGERLLGKNIQPGGAERAFGEDARQRLLVHDGAASAC